MTLAVFHDFPGLGNGLIKLHDFPGRVVTLYVDVAHYYMAQMILSGTDFCTCRMSFRSPN